MFIFDTTYLLFILPCVVISLICQVRVKTAFSKYGQIPNERGMTGAQAAEYVNEKIAVGMKAEVRVLEL